MQSRWIGFSEDDGLIDRRRRRYDQAAEPQLVTQRVEDNPFHLYARACGASRIAPWLQHHPCHPCHPWFNQQIRVHSCPFVVRPEKEKRQEDLHLPALFSVSGGNCLRRYFVPTTK